MRQQLLQLTLPLIRTHGFTRQTLANAAFALPSPHPQPLSERAISSLFGEGEQARITLINYWLEDAKKSMSDSSSSPTIRGVLAARLKHNEPLLDLLPEAFALLTASSSPFTIDPRPAVTHAFGIADEACHIVGVKSVGPSWYARRASLAAVYGAAELHQLNSPRTAYDFLDALLETSSKVHTAVNEVNTFADYIQRSAISIFKSRGVF
ncbi:hypothetical protein BXZ70DRAFT_936820 [Cristinia sonorae]|uniref:Ubiquinone biosynthesis protein n=1 Tax=Cristinia sonorae TaxID=1940300 RepID=A0A8K0URF4_9AGAR|nr:hypothetical protein BXZ70DRAFT_936820 [Cristinia sonorae]